LRLKPEEARRLRRQIVELLILEARAGVIVSSHGGSEDDRRGALIRAVAHLDQAERVDAALPSVLFAERASYHAALGDADLAARDRAGCDLALGLVRHGMLPFRAGALPGSRRRFQRVRGARTRICLEPFQPSPGPRPGRPAAGCEGVV